MGGLYWFKAKISLLSLVTCTVSAGELPCWLVLTNLSDEETKAAGETTAFRLDQGNIDVQSSVLTATPAPTRSMPSAAQEWELKVKHTHTKK